MGCRHAASLLRKDCLGLVNRFGFMKLAFVLAGRVTIVPIAFAALLSDSKGKLCELRL